MITKAEIRQAAIAAGISADDVDKLLGPGLALPSADQRLTLRLVVDDGDTFHDPADGFGLKATKAVQES